jgi:hypothetical protein
MWRLLHSWDLQPYLAARLPRRWSPWHAYRARSLARTPFPSLPSLCCSGVRARTDYTEEEKIHLEDMIDRTEVRPSPLLATNIYTELSFDPFLRLSGAQYAHARDAVRVFRG